MRKFFAKVHLWLSIPFGIIIAIVCLTGAILVFETEILELGYNKYDYRESIVIDYVSVRYTDFLKRINYHQKKIM